MNLTTPNRRLQKVAPLELSEEAAMDLAKIGKLKVGWVLCRVRQRATILRCYKCLGFEHTARTCRTPDRSKLCFKGGQERHTAKKRQGKLHCVICAGKGSDPAMCVSREALNRRKTLLNDQGPASEYASECGS